MANKFTPYKSPTGIQFINFDKVTKISVSRGRSDAAIEDSEDKYANGSAFVGPLTIDIFLGEEKLHWCTIPNNYFGNVTGPLDCTEIDIANLYCSALAWSCGNMNLSRFKAILTNPETASFEINGVCNISRKDLIDELQRIKDLNCPITELDLRYGVNNLKGLNL